MKRFAIICFGVVGFFFGRSENMTQVLCLSAPPFPPRVNTCPNNCSGRGECRVGNSTSSIYCECEANWKGPACDVPYCQADCGEPNRGLCQGKSCICKAGWQGKLGRWGWGGREFCWKVRRLFAAAGVMISWGVLFFGRAVTRSESKGNSAELLSVSLFPR